MINTTIKITICDPTSLERSQLVTSARQAGMRSLKKSKVYRGKIADMWPRATRARLRRSTVCPVKRGRGAKRKKQGKTKKCVGARQLSYAPHNAARQNPTHYSFTHNMMSLVCRPLLQCTDAGVTAHFGQPHARAF